MKYKSMKFNKILSELDSEEKARNWVWLARFDGKEFVCPKCQHENYYQHRKSPEVRPLSLAVEAFKHSASQISHS